MELALASVSLKRDRSMLTILSQHCEDGVQGSASTPVLGVGARTTAAPSCAAVVAYYLTEMRATPREYLRIASCMRAAPWRAG